MKKKTFQIGKATYFHAYKLTSHLFPDNIIRFYLADQRKKRVKVKALLCKSDCVCESANVWNIIIMI